MIARTRFAVSFLGWSVVACGGAAGPGSARTAPAAAQAPSAPGASEDAGPSEEEVEVPVSTRNPTWGSRLAPVTIVEFADFECPFCLRVEQTLARIRETYGPERVRIVWKNSPLPFHPNARSSAEAAMGVFAFAGNGAFWKFHDTALRSQGSLGPAAYEQWAKEAGVADTAMFRIDLVAHRFAKVIDADAQEGQTLGVFGTPCFFVNGVPLAGALPFVTFQSLIDQQVKLAQAKIAAGTPRGTLYAQLVRDNRAAAAGSEDETEPTDAKTVYAVPVGKSPVRGPPSALVTIIEFADYECPFCIRAEATMKALREKYGDELRVVFKDAPLSFHPRAEPAAEAALEVRAERGDVAFWAMHDDLLGSPADLSDESLISMAVRHGARGAAVKAALESHVHADSIAADADLAEDFEANGTPHFFVNGRRLVGALPMEKIESIIEEELGKARELVANGASRRTVYDEIVRGGKGPVEPEKKTLPVPFPARNPGRGSPSARVTVHEWSDFQCPFCKRVESTLEQVARDYGSRVRLVWHDLPLPMHPDARLAARAAREAFEQKGERGFWAMHDDLFAHQDLIRRGDLDTYARQLGLNLPRWKAALDGDAHDSEVEADRAVAEGMSISGTPGFLIVPSGSPSGYFIGGAQRYAKFRRLIDRAMAESQ